jgi:hypothetical protein
MFGVWLSFLHWPPLFFHISGHIFSALGRIIELGHTPRFPFHVDFLSFCLDGTDDYFPQSFKRFW